SLLRIFLWYHFVSKWPEVPHLTKPCILFEAYVPEVVHLQPRILCCGKSGYLSSVPYFIKPNDTASRAAVVPIHPAQGSVKKRLKLNCSYPCVHSIHPGE